jgi:hypothetical protein
MALQEINEGRQLVFPVDRVSSAIDLEQSHGFGWDRTASAEIYGIGHVELAVASFFAEFHEDLAWI